MHYICKSKIREVTQEQIDQWASRSDVIKVDGHNAIHIDVPEAMALVTILWSHRGIFPMYSNKDDRFSINIVTGDNYRESKMTFDQYLFDFAKYRYLLVNSHEPNYAILYSISVNTTERIFILRIKEYPLLGKLIISVEEEEGIKVKF